jgi:hypothetical protein
MTVVLDVTVIDDDGVAVVASESALVARAARGAFDYEFPNALVEGMRARELFAWRTGGEGEHHVVVEIVPDDVFDRSQTETTPEHLIVIGEDDAVLLLPYSQFTYACDHGPEPTLRNGGKARVQASTYRVRVLKEDDDRSSFRVLLCAAPSAARLEKEPSVIPGWDD